MLSETQKAAVADKRFQMHSHLNCEDKGVLVHRCDALKLTRVVVTPKTHGQWGKGVTTYSVDGIETEFSDLGEALKAAGIE